MSQFRSLKLVLTGLLLAGVFFSGSVQAKWPVQAGTQTTIAVAELPKQGLQVYELIHQGGPFAFDKDGVTFFNRERLLPAANRGYYREYTVAKPGARNRGVRRIVCGGQVKTPDICYYTADHYASFRKIVP